MPKLPKELQKKKKAQITKVKGPSGAQSKPGASRAMRRKLQAQGIEGMDQIDAQSVIIRCSDKEIVIENPQVVQLKQQGMTIHQVIGEPFERELTYSDEESDDYQEAEYSEETEDEPESESTEISIKQQDIILVAAQANVSEEEAKTALEEAEGDLARAILKLKTK